MLELLIGAAVLCCSVVLAFGCVCHLFKRHSFTNFEDDPETGRGVSMYQSNESSHDASNVTFEALPDILAKTGGSRALRPRITCSDRDTQSNAAKLVTVYQPFPRNQLIYVKEIGLGWFGQVLQGNAENIIQESRVAKVVVKILKDDATAAEKAQFLEEVAPYREFDQPNILRLLGQCTETSPFLTVLEYPALGDLKSYLQTEKSGPYIQFAMDAARGLSCMHKHSYVHHDFAARNCQLMPDLTVKIGDYGIGEDMFREDYYDTGRDLLPIRWMSPESLELKQGVWIPKGFTAQSNVWSLSVLLWEILSGGRKPFANLRDEDVLQKVIREGNTKLPPPNSQFPLHDRWYEIMEMCWQEVEDRPSADDILAFLIQVNEESSQTPKFDKHWNNNPSSKPKDVHVNLTGAQTVADNNTNFSSSNINQSNQHVAEVLVHRVDEQGQQQGFDDDFSKIQIKKNRESKGFEDDFVHIEDTNLNYSQNDSILAYGGNSDDAAMLQQTGYKDILSADTNMNTLLPEPVPVQMSTPSKSETQSKDQSEAYNTALSNISTVNSKYVTAMNGSSQSSMYSSDIVSRSDRTGNSISSKNLKDTFSEKSENQNTDEGYRTYMNGTPDIVVTDNHGDIDMLSKDIKSMINISPFKASDLETEKAREIYMTKGAAIPPSIMHRSRSLGTIPEDGIPSDNTSQTGAVFDDESETEDVGMNFEWDDYEGEELVGRVRYSSDESSTRSPRTPRHVEVEEWPFEQDSSSESHSKPGSLASDSDAEVTHHSIGSNTSIDTRARIASILTNRLNSLIKQTNQSQSAQSMFYSFSQSEYDLDSESPEHALTDIDHHPSKRNPPADTDFHTTLGMLSEGDEDMEVTPPESSHGQDDHLIKQDLDSIVQSVLGHKSADNKHEEDVTKNTDDSANVSFSDPNEQMLQTESTTA